MCRVLLWSEVAETAGRRGAFKTSFNKFSEALRGSRGDSLNTINVQCCTGQRKRPQNCHLCGFCNETLHIYNKLK